MLNTLPKNLPTESKVWIHPLVQSIHGQTLNDINEKLSSFVNQWEYHNTPAPGYFFIYLNRFVFLINSNKISGCSIDSSFQVINKINQQLGELRKNYFYFLNSEGEVMGFERHNAQTKINSGEIKPNTIIYNLGVQTLEDLQEGKFECPAHQSWLKKYFKTI